MNNENPINLLSDVLQFQSEVSKALNDASSKTTGRSRKYAIALSDYFASSPTPEQVVSRPDAMAICAPLIELASDDSSPQPTPWQIDDAVQSGLSYSVARKSIGGRLMMLIGYPMLVLSVAVVLLVAYLILLVPIFDQMFREFGLPLPVTTQRIIAASHLLIAWWPWISAVVISVPLLASFLAWQFHQSSRPVWASWFASIFGGTSEALSQWTSHVAMLVRSGFSVDRSIGFAGSASEKNWLRDSSQRWSRQLRNGEVALGDELSVQGVPCRLLAFAIHTANEESSQKLAVDLLIQSAIIFHERARIRQSKMLAFVAPVVFCGVVGIVGTLLVALFQPLTSLISGLA